MQTSPAPEQETEPQPTPFEQQIDAFQRETLALFAGGRAFDLRYINYAASRRAGFTAEQLVARYSQAAAFERQFQSELPPVDFGNGNVPPREYRDDGHRYYHDLERESEKRDNDRYRRGP